MQPKSRKQIPSATERARDFIHEIRTTPLTVGSPQFQDRLVEILTDASKDGLRRAGAKGGRKTAKVHGEEHYQTIGRKGGATVKKAVAMLRNKEK